MFQSGYVLSVYSNICFDSVVFIIMEHGRKRKFMCINSEIDCSIDSDSEVSSLFSSDGESEYYPYFDNNDDSANEDDERKRIDFDEGLDPTDPIIHDP